MLECNSTQPSSTKWMSLRRPEEKAQYPMVTEINASQILQSHADELSSSSSSSSSLIFDEKDTNMCLLLQFHIHPKLEVFFSHFGFSCASLIGNVQVVVQDTLIVHYGRVSGNEL
ncbi:hypothetical protein V8C43DRAFT_266547 [Trichoderma afarasin]